MRKLEFSIGKRKHKNGEYRYRVIAAKALGRPLPKGVVVHHHDNVCDHDENSNLVICEDASYHKLLHRRQLVLEAGGDPNTQRFCGKCGQPRDFELFGNRNHKRYGLLEDSICKPCRKSYRPLYEGSEKHIERRRLYNEERRRLTQLRKVSR